MTATIQYIDAIDSPADQTEYTFNDVPFGNESEERIVALCIETRKTGGALCEIVECTIGGITADIVHQRASAPSGTVNFAGIVSAPVPTGTHGTVFIKFSLPVLRVGVQILNVTGTLVDADSSILEHPSVNFDIPAGGVALGCMSVASSSAFDWVGLTDVHRSLVEGALRVSVGIEEYPAGASNQTLGIQRTAGSWSGVVGTFAVWGPASDPPENLTPPSLSIDETSFTGSVGLWDSMGAGPLTYEWELRDGTDAAIASGTGTTISGSGSFSGQYYLWVRATNSVGSEEAVSSLVVVSTGGVEVNLDNVNSSSRLVSLSDALSLVTGINEQKGISNTLSSSSELSAILNTQSTKSRSNTKSNISDLTISRLISLENINSLSGTISKTDSISISFSIVNKNSVSRNKSSINNLTTALSISLDSIDSISKSKSEEKSLNLIFGPLSTNTLSKSFSRIDATSIIFSILNSDGLSRTLSEQNIVGLTRGLGNVNSLSRALSTPDDIDRGFNLESIDSLSTTLSSIDATTINFSFLDSGSKSRTKSPNERLGIAFQLGDINNLSRTLSEISNLISRSPVNLDNIFSFSRTVSSIESLGVNYGLEDVQNRSSIISIINPISVIIGVQDIGSISRVISKEEFLSYLFELNEIKSKSDTLSQLSNLTIITDTDNNLILQYYFNLLRG